MRGAVLVACLCLSCGEDLSTPIGEGSLRRVQVPGGRALVESLATPDEKFVVVGTTGPLPILYSTGPDLAILHATDARGRLAKAGTRAHQLLACSGLRFELLSIPKLAVLDTLWVTGETERTKVVGNPIALHPHKGGWIFVSRVGRIAVVSASPLRLGKSGQSGTRFVQVAALDTEGSVLILCGEQTVEVFDLALMKSRGVTHVEADEIGFFACARDGTAWIATKNGRFLHFDIATRTITGWTRLGKVEKHNDVTLDLSASGRHLAACSTEFVKGGARPTVLKVFRVEGNKLSAVASRNAVLGPLNDITILETQKVVILSSEHLVAWHYGDE